MHPRRRSQGARYKAARSIGLLKGWCSAASRDRPARSWIDPGLFDIRLVALASSCTRRLLQARDRRGRGAASAFHFFSLMHCHSFRLTASNLRKRFKDTLREVGAALSDAELVAISPVGEMPMRLLADHRLLPTSFFRFAARGGVLGLDWFDFGTCCL